MAATEAWINGGSFLGCFGENGGAGSGAAGGDGGFGVFYTGGGAGISGYVLKSDPTSDPVLAIKAVRQGGTCFSANAPNILLTHMKKLEEGKASEDAFDKLSLRERKVFCLLAEGKSVKDVSDRLCISPKTVGSHKYNIMGKLDAQYADRSCQDCH